MDAFRNSPEYQRFIVDVSKVVVDATPENQRKLHKLIDEWKTGMYSDFCSPLSFPKMTLDLNLKSIPGTREIRENIVKGKYDA